ncbi:MAG: hypothetical protein A3G60_03975 [Candidatus Ryanbacteria bacterium RIFCSPLOWO2_12_FULL_47_9c]|uniref:Transcriptional regulator n=2 Tax=Candidatus Ryaniibacteriota TaxID=1817914 RepID=A0A1G2H415_9BACT|nr:MAG: hypothetical protein A3J04_03725 [Candidatus Ryanbacteria bacterium RIFCSPLOWO2_02_FULL_47_14]OGZ57050.1 MAG: hypothetical protein A3G60_03975 [Candidatus Ryanbacteria bacterium RIFCSPLOWO2_12_FULL_47_9c]
MPQGTILEKLFGSQARVRLLRLFVMSPDDVLDSKTIGSRIHLEPTQFNREVKMLFDVGFIKKGTRVTTLSEGVRNKLKRRKISGYTLVRDFPYLNEIAELLASETPLARKKLLGSLKGCGKVNLVVIAGRLLHEDRSHVDVFVVGDSLKKKKIERALHAIEANLGKELVYAIMATKEFQYRFGMYDRFLKDLFDHPHEILLNKLGIG